MVGRPEGRVAAIIHDHINNPKNYSDEKTIVICSCGICGPVAQCLFKG